MEHVNVDDSSDDNLRTVRPERHAPGNAWTDAFDAQCTDTMLKRLRRYALVLARCPGGARLGDPTDYAEELTQAVLTDVIEGVLRWDPSARDLEPYLADVIRLRVRRDRKRAARHPHVSLDALHPHAHASLLDEMDRQLAASASERSHDRDTDSWDTMTANLARLRKLVVADTLALRFLDAPDQKAKTRVEIMKLDGLTRAEYHNTRRRVARLLAHLHADRRTPAKDN